MMAEIEAVGSLDMAATRAARLLDEGACECECESRSRWVGSPYVSVYIVYGTTT